MVDYLLPQLKNDDEALAMISGLGFSRNCWPFIDKIGGALKLFSSGVFDDIINNKAASFAHGTQNIRSLFDVFYESFGFLWSIKKNPQSLLFRYKLSPLVFFCRYDKELLEYGPRVAIVGTRTPSVRALSFTKKLSEVLSEKNIIVVSGGARGIDAQAHNAAKKTIIVSGLKTDMHKDHYWTVRKNLLVIYPFGPFLPQGKFMFLERNRYVAGLADAVVIVQGKQGSGTLSTANFAHELSIPLYALPGDIFDPLAFVPNQLLQMGIAKAITDIEQFATSLVTKPNNPLKKPCLKAKKQVEKGEQNKSLPYLLQLINDHQNSLGFDELLAITKKSLPDLQGELLHYEMAGRIIKRGSQFVLTGK